MSTNGSQFDPLYRTQPVKYSGGYEGGEGREKKKKKKVNYMGHQWAESEEGSPLQEFLRMPEKMDREKGVKPPKPLVIEAMLLKKASELFKQLGSLEDKIAQLFFYKTEANYDSKMQKDLTEILQEWQLGGVLFMNGSYKRQADLIEYYQEFSQIPLLIGNDFIHNLSFYFQKEVPNECLTAQHCRDLGKAVMGQNRSLGVHFLFDRERVEEVSSLIREEAQKSSFRKGIRLAHGVVARDLLPEKALSRIQSLDGALFQKGKGDRTVKEDAQKFIGMRTLFLQECVIEKEALFEAFARGYEAFLVEGDLSKAITLMSEAVRSGEICEQELERRLMKILIIKSFFWG